MLRPSSAVNAAERAATNVKRIVGENIKARRIALGLSQEELAEKFGVSRTALSQYEIGAGEVNAGALPRLARILGISTLSFFERHSEDYYTQPLRHGTDWMIDRVSQNSEAEQLIAQKRMSRARLWQKCCRSFWNCLPVTKTWCEEW